MKNEKKRLKKQEQQGKTFRVVLFRIK